MRRIARTVATGCALCPLLALAASEVWADIYKYRQPDGGILLTDKPQAGAGALLKRFTPPGGSIQKPVPPAPAPGSAKAPTPIATPASASMGEPENNVLYKYRARDGVILITDRRMGGDFTLIKVFRGLGGPPKAPAMPRLGMPNSRFLHANRARYAPIIARVAQREGLDVQLLHAVILAESAYDPNAVSVAGATGLMQLMPGTARRYGVIDSTDPEANVKGGAKYLKDLLDLFDNNMELVLAAYNAGEGAVAQYGNRIPPYPETQQYVRKVLAYYRGSATNPL
jgi:hypothetical protein